MKPGRDTAQLAVWISDDDPPEKLVSWQQSECPRRLRESAKQHGVLLGPIRYYTLKPGEGQAGHPPKGVQGTNMRLLVAEAEVVGFMAVQKAPTSFLADLSAADLKRLREVTRRGAARSGRTLTDKECDMAIELLGPKAAERVLKELVDGSHR